MQQQLPQPPKFADSEFQITVHQLMGLAAPYNPSMRALESAIARLRTLSEHYPDMTDIASDMERAMNELKGPSLGG